MPSWRKDDSLRLLTAIASVNSTSITCFTQKWDSYRDTDIFTIQFFAALKNSTLVWPMSVVQGVVLHRGEFPPVLVPRRSFHGHLPIHHTHVISRDAPLTGRWAPFPCHRSCPTNLTWTVSKTSNNFTFNSWLGENQLVSVLEACGNNVRAINHWQPR